MDGRPLLVAAGTVLLAGAALLGFVQERYRDRPVRFAEWRVGHAGGTAGAVQLLALAAVWDDLAAPSIASMTLASALAIVAWAFFLGPLARALARPWLARRLNILGAVLAVPVYLALPCALW